MTQSMDHVGKARSNGRKTRGSQAKVVVTEPADPEMCRLLSSRQPAKRYIQKNYEKLCAQHPGKFVAVVDAGRTLRAFVSHRQAQDFVDSLEQTKREGSIVIFADKPWQVYAV